MDTGAWWGLGFSMCWIFPLLCLIFMVVMMIMMFRRGGGSCMPMHRDSISGPTATRETPRQILDRRLASGQLTREQYDAIRRDLEAPGDDR